MEATEININALNNNKPTKSSSRSFKLKNRKHDKHDKHTGSDQDISLDQGLAEAQEAIDLFFNNQFEESREIAQRQLSVYRARMSAIALLFSVVIKVFTMPWALGPSTT